MEEDTIAGVNKTETYKFVNNKTYIYNNLSAIRDIQQKKRDSIIYTIQGQRVRKAVKGLYILNGKVVFAK